MKDTQAIIERVRRINKQYQHLELAVEDSLTRIKPGQSLLVRVAPFAAYPDDDSWHPYLREQWWPVNLQSSKLVIERPADTHYEPGQVVNALGLIGQPFRFRPKLRSVMLIAYDTPPTPLLMTIPWLLGNKIATTLILLGNAVDYDTLHIPHEIEIIRGVKPTPTVEGEEPKDPATEYDEALQWQNQVLTVGWADQVFVVVAQDNELERFKRVWALFSKLRHDIPRNYIFGAFQPPLACGVGTCWGCPVPLMESKEIGHELVCVRGPAYDLSLLKLT
jgi:hypothetical protein